MLVPGPTVTLIIGNSLRHGTRAGLLNVAGGQVGLAIIIALVGIGLTSLIETMGHWFDLLRLAGAAYLVWLGWRMIRSSGELADGARVGAHPPPGARGGRVGRGLPPQHARYGQQPQGQPAHTWFAPSFWLVVTHLL